METNLLEKFKNSLKKRYLFHLHTNYTDGQSSVKEYCAWAVNNGYDVLIFTEHVRKNLSYNFYSFLNEIKTARQRFPKLEIWVGVEAKILSDGDLDIPQKILPEIQVICFACHSFPENINLYETSFKKIFLDNRWRSHVRIWVHPGYFLNRLNLIENYSYILRKLISFAIKEGVFIEHNMKYNLPPAEIIKNIPNSKLIKGLDAHSVDFLETNLFI